MNLSITIDDQQHSIENVDSSSAQVKGMECCPRCKAKGPVRVAGKNLRIESHDTYASDGLALCCMKRLGTIRAVMSTIFGLEEDERVLNGRPRVY